MSRSSTRPSAVWNRSTRTGTTPASAKTSAGIQLYSLRVSTMTSTSRLRASGVGSAATSIVVRKIPMASIIGSPRGSCGIACMRLGAKNCKPPAPSVRSARPPSQAAISLWPALAERHTFERANPSPSMTHRSNSLAACFAIALAALAAPIPVTRADAQTADIAKLQDEAVRHTREYLRINTTNPPGNEVETMRWFARIFAQEGIPFDTATSAPGRGNIWARLKGGSQPALVLLHHMDVVPADPKYWSTDPFAAATTIVGKDSMIAGRGALDTKTLGVMELEAFLALHRAKTPLDRDVIFIATADEEAGGMYGAGWLVKNHPEAFKGAGMLLNEGGDGNIGDDGKVQVSIEVTQKTPLWLELTALGKPGHGSTPPPA